MKPAQLSAILLDLRVSRFNVGGADLREYRMLGVLAALPTMAGKPASIPSQASLFVESSMTVLGS